ncbi:hypothetical protein QBC40DRAFT_292326 [Triangularia verruculosa]|uniref:Uncharacterized protein n=1 Tax=Triangularia verruculosa TaxID=2587418 RepID=A0AAN7AZW9_9PEZI|nr:hypothetical protein QBC40DRAFT_292326 [Triangularia verruculosa]
MNHNTPQRQQGLHPDQDAAPPCHEGSTPGNEADATSADASWPRGCLRVWRRVVPGLVPGLVVLGLLLGPATGTATAAAAPAAAATVAPLPPSALEADMGQSGGACRREEQDELEAVLAAWRRAKPDRTDHRHAGWESSWRLKRAVTAARDHCTKATVLLIRATGVDRVSNWRAGGWFVVSKLRMSGMALATFARNRNSRLRLLSIMCRMMGSEPGSFARRLGMDLLLTKEAHGGFDLWLQALRLAKGRSQVVKGARLTRGRREDLKEVPQVRANLSSLSRTELSEPLTDDLDAFRKEVLCPVLYWVLDADFPDGIRDLGAVDGSWNDHLSNGNERCGGNTVVLVDEKVAEKGSGSRAGCKKKSKDSGPV